MASTLLLYPTDSDNLSCNGRSLQFSGSLGTAPPHDGKIPTLDGASTAPDRSSPPAPVTSPSIRTAPSVKAPLRIIKPHRSRAHPPVQTPGRRSREPNDDSYG